MTVRTKSIYEPAAPEDGVRVLVTRFYPRGVKRDRFDLWVKALSPSRALLASYRSGEKRWSEFDAEFRAEVSSSGDALAALDELATLAAERDVTLLCYERTGAPCHRLVVRELLAARAPRREEARSGDLRRYIFNHAAESVAKFQSERFSAATEETARRPPESRQQEGDDPPQDRRGVPRARLQRRRLHERDP